MSHNLRGRLARLEYAGQPNGARVDNVLSLLGRLEEASGQTLAEVFQDPYGPGAHHPDVAKLVALLTA